MDRHSLVEHMGALMFWVCIKPQAESRISLLDEIYHICLSQTESYRNCREHNADAGFDTI